MFLAWFTLTPPFAAVSAAGTVALCGVLALVLALWIDRRLGEPPVVLHPVVWMGRYLAWCGQRTARCPPTAAFGLGALAWCLGAAFTALVALGLQTLLFWQVGRTGRVMGWADWAGAVLLIVCFAGVLKATLSWRMLHREVLAVEAALGESLSVGRERLSWLVSRDTANLSADEVRESAIESLAENLNDSVVAPIFWFVLFGLPGAAVYRFANTADAMWGYRGVRHGQTWEWAGKWAARMDDVLSWVPARLTALLIVAVTQGVTFNTLRAEARRTPSPNSGWPMAAMAIALGIRLGKPGVYTLNAAGRIPQAADTLKTIKKASNVLLTLVFMACSAMLFVAF
jgi:adenosylcobinamide-phosphate synthase